MPPVNFSEMLKLPAYGWWGIADGYSQRTVNHNNNHSWILHQWNAQNLGMHKGLGLLCRAGGEYAGKGSHNRNKGRIKNCNGVDGKQEHYKVLGLARNATALEIKRAFRRLARRYHPDVNKDPDADDSFKSIRLAYEVLSNEATRNQYDKALRLQELRTNRHWRKWAESDLKRKRRYYWEQLKQQAPGAMWEQDHGAETPFSSFYSYSSFEDEEFVNSPTEERAPVEDLLRHVWFTIFCSQMLGSKIALTLFSFCALLNRQIAPGYKVAHIVACLIGGQRGILVMVGLSFTSWFYGNSGDNLVALIALALWIGVDLARFVPIPRGAILAMTYLCYKLQLEGS